MLLNRVRRYPDPLADGEEVTIQQVSGEGGGLDDSKNDDQLEAAPKVEEGLEEATCCEVQKEATPGIWGSRLRPCKARDGFKLEKGEM